MGLKAAVIAAVLGLVPAGAAAAPRHTSSASWALPQIRAVTSVGLMGAKSPATFRPNALLTNQALANLVFGLQQLLAPPAPVVQPAPPPTVVTDPVTTDPTSTDPTATDPTVTDPTVTDPPQTTTDPTVTDPTVTDPTTTVPEPVPAPVPAPTPPKATHPTASATIATLDAQLVDGLGLGAAAAEFAQKTQAAGLTFPWRFGTEVAARLLGLRIDHPAREDSIELLPDDPSTRAEAAYSAAQIMHTSGWLVPVVQAAADSFSLPTFSTWQKRILDTAFARIGMPYVWGGTSDGPEVDFGIAARGGYDCSGFVWRVYKLTKYPGEGDLASVLRGRTTYVMSGEVPRSQLIDFAHLQPADVIFFGAHGPRSAPSEVDHTGIYVGDGWFINSSEYGVALAQLTGYYRQHFAWGRRPLREAGLSG